MNSIYQDLYRKSAYTSKRSEESKKKCFVVWKDKRNQVFDAQRETLIFDKKDVTPNDKENKRPKKKFLIEWKNERKKNIVPKKKPPFVVGIVRHKIYSPPILQKERKKILRQSFAPKNYKFKPPAGLKINVLKPIAEKKIPSPFTFKSIFDAQNQIISNKKEHAFENVTMRSRAKPLTDSTPNRAPNRTPKKTKIKKDFMNQKCEDQIKKELNTDSTDEPPIFGKLNLLKYIEKPTNRKTYELPNESSISDPLISSNEIIKNSKPEDDSCTLSCNNQKQEESSVTKDSNAEKECKPATLFSCSQQIQNLLEQKDLRFTELYSNESNKIMKRTSEMPSPDISRISFTSSDTLKEDNVITNEIKNNIKESKDNIGKSNSLELINNELNITIHADDSNIVDEEPPTFFNLTPNIIIPENLEEDDLNVIQEYSPISEIVKSPAKRISKDNILTENEDNRISKEFNNSFNLSPSFTDVKNDSKKDEKEDHLIKKEASLENVEVSLSGSKTLKNQNLFDTENNVLPKLSNGNSFDEETALDYTSKLIIPEDNIIPKVDVLIQQEVSKCTESIENIATSEKNHSTVFTENINISTPNLLKELSPRDHSNKFNLQREIIFSSKTCLENDQKSILEKTSLNVSSNDFIKRESMSLLQGQSTETLTNDLSVNKMKENENNKEPEIIELSDSPLKQENVNCEKNSVLSKLYNKVTVILHTSLQNSVVEKTLSIEKKNIEPTLSSTGKTSDIINLVDSPKVVKELSEPLTIQDKSSCPNLQETQKFVTDDCKPLINLANDKKLQNSQTVEVETVDLISDDEEVTESFLSQIKARYAINTIISPKLKPERKALASLENIQSSPCKTLSRQMFSKENSPIKQKIPVFRVSPCSTPRSPLLTKENSLATSVLASPIKILTLRNRKVNVSPSPKKQRNTPKKALNTKNNLPKVNDQTQENNGSDLNADKVAVSSLENIRKSICKTPLSQVQLLDEENLLTPNTTASPMRILSLRNRKVGVSPSPKKRTKTPRKALFTKNNLPEVNDQTPKNVADEINENRISSSQDVQNSTCNTPRLREQAKENNIPSLHISPCEIPQAKLLAKENCPVTNIVSSPMRILSLRSRKVDVTPSPKKKTPKKTRGKKTPAKCEK